MLHSKFSTVSTNRVPIKSTATQRQVSSVSCRYATLLKLARCAWIWIQDLLNLSRRVDIRLTFSLTPHRVHPTISTKLWAEIKLEISQAAPKSHTVRTVKAYLRLNQTSSKRRLASYEKDYITSSKTWLPMNGQLVGLCRPKVTHFWRKLMPKAQSKILEFTNNQINAAALNKNKHWSQWKKTGNF